LVEQNGEGNLEKGIKDPEAYYHTQFKDPKIKVTYFYRETDKLGKKK
jgi:hypothetical protein